MKALRSVAIVFASVSVTAAVAIAGEFDGTTPLTCTTQQGHDCVPAAPDCVRLTPESKGPEIVGIDFAKREVRSPYREALLHVAHATTNKDSLVLQGADLLFAWSALVDKKTGALTVAIADREGAYVVFGQCKPIAAK